MTTIILFGATGDLAQHKLLPALLQLAKDTPDDGELPMIIAVGRRAYSTVDFYTQLKASLGDKFATYEPLWQRFTAHLQYCQLDFFDGSQYSKLIQILSLIEAGKATTNRLFYLSVSPEGYSDILSLIAQNGLHEQQGGSWRQVVIEKPFGSDEKSAKVLGDHIRKLYTGHQVYRVDHYLAKETVQNLLAFRFSNGIFEPLWNSEHIDHIQITVAEEEGIKTRAAYYDGTGAFRDVVQNHILQLVAFLLMEQPAAFTYDALSDAKSAVLKGLDFEPNSVIFGQYEGYLQEPGVAADSDTETYAMVELSSISPRWKGVPIYIRTGKKLKTRMTEISVQFKAPVCALFTMEDSTRRANVLNFRVQPDEGISLRLAVKQPRKAMEVRAVKMEFCYAPVFKQMLPDAYERLFQDLLAKDRTLSLREDTIELSWQLVDKILASKSTHPIESYPAFSWGPSRADHIIANQQDRYWLADESTICNGVVLDES